MIPGKRDSLVKSAIRVGRDLIASARGVSGGGFIGFDGLF